MKVALYRIVGNALPHRHGPSDFIDQLRYTLQNEPPLENCEKRWILNRIVDAEIRAILIAELERHGAAFEQIPFDERAYQETFYDAAGLPDRLIPRLGGIGGGARRLRRSEVWLFRHRSHQLININHARNLALEQGGAFADWIMPLDGWCYFTQPAWDQVRQAIAMATAADARYLIMPLQRLATWPTEAMTRETAADAEPQIAFRRDALGRFNESRRYGEHNKAEFLAALGAPGPWLGWKPDAWQAEVSKLQIPDARWIKGGRVLRLPSGASPQTEKGDVERHFARHAGVASLSGRLDQAIMRRAPLRAFVSGVNAALQTPQITRWLQGGSLQVETARLRALPLRTVLDKGDIPPSGDRNDYFSLARYVHERDGGQIHIDGVSSPPNIAGSKESRRHDKFSLADFFAVTATAALGEGETGAGALEPARAWLSAWLIDPATRMNPSARFAQWDPARPDRPSPWGLIDLREAWMLPPLVEMMFEKGAISLDERNVCLSWCQKLVQSLTSTPQGVAGYRHPNNIGTWSHLLIMALCIFGERYGTAATCYREATVRLYQQFGAKGEQPQEQVRATPLHYVMFNLTGWTLMANLLRHYHYDIWRYSAGGTPLLTEMFDRVELDGAPEYLANPRKFDDWMRLLQALRPGADDAAITALDQVDWQSAGRTGVPFNPGAYAFCLACARSAPG